MPWEGEREGERGRERRMKVNERKLSGRHQTVSRNNVRESQSKFRGTAFLTLLTL